MTDKQIIFTGVDHEGNVHEIEGTPAQGRRLDAGGSIAYWPRDEQVFVDDDGKIIYRESAVPPEAA